MIELGKGAGLMSGKTNINNKLNKEDLKDILKKIEEKWQARWREARLFEADAQPGKPKFFITFPYPYVNSLPHLGSAFTVLRVDVMARYKRMRGYNVLFPQGWHATGGPIVASALRLREGDPKIINTLKMQGIPDDEIPKFKDPEYWVYYFTKEWRKDFERYGLSIDWRREFFTTRLNPPYNKFIEWQYLKLKDLGLVAKGEHPVVWCPREKKVVGDHDRPDEYAGISPVEAVIVKFRDLEGRIIPALTFRPETIFGVTNIWVHPDAEYVVASVDNEEWIINKYMAEELSDQKHKVKIKYKIKSKELIGKTVKHPLRDEWIVILPASFVDPDLGTGIVMSVPAHAPYDYVALEELKRKPGLLKEYGIKPELIQQLKPIPLIKVHGYTEIPARDAVKKRDIKSQEERELLEEATKEIYSKEYHTGILLENTGQFAGMKVSEAKDKIASWLISQNAAVKIFTLPEKVYCRCGARTHVKIVSDQWFLLYSREDWKRKAHEAVDSMRFYPENFREIFHKIIDWYKDWACTHMNELGTPLPWDPQWVVESLSDSTIYMAYYTVAKYLQHPEIYGIRPEQLKPELFDYIFLGKGNPEIIAKITGIPIKLIEEMRKEFIYWYPVDMRISGKDLVQNHLTFFIFHHTAIFPREHWPRSIGVNGWVLLRGRKMSKTTGNFITLRQALQLWGADPTRWAEIIGGGDPGVDDANFEPEVAEKAAEDLYSWIMFARENYGKGRDTRRPIDDWFESILNRTIIKTTEFMEQTKYKSALVEGYYNLQTNYRWYLRRAGSPNKELLKQFIEIQTLLIAPIVPHVAEEVWSLIGKEGFASTAKWPEPDYSKIREDVEKAEEILIKLLDDSRELLKLIGKVKKLYIIIAAQWKYDFIKKVVKHKKEGLILRDAINKSLSEMDKKERAQAGKLVKLVMKFPEILPLYIERDIELSTLRDSKEFLERELGVEVQILTEEEAENIPKGKQALPAKPALYALT